MPNRPDKHDEGLLEGDKRPDRLSRDAGSIWPGGDPLWQKMLYTLPMGVAILEARSGATLWVNAELKRLLRDGAGQFNVIGNQPIKYVPALNIADWNDTVAQLMDPPFNGLPSEPRRVQFPHHTTRVIAYWDWTLKVIDDTQPPRFLMLTIQSVSDAVMNERLLKSAGRLADRARRRAEALGQLTQLVNASFTTTELLRSVTDQAAAFFDVPHAAVLLLRPNGHFDIGYSVGLDEEANKRLSERLTTDNTLAGKAIAARQTLVLRDRFDSDFETPLLADKTPPSSLVSSPIWRGKHNYGVVEVYFTEPRDIPEDARALLAAFSDQTAIALEKSDLYEQIAEQRRQLQSIFDNAPVGIVYMQTDGRILAANAAAAEKYGRPVDGMAGEPGPEILTDIPFSLFQQVCKGEPFHASHHVYQTSSGADTLGAGRVRDGRVGDSRIGDDKKGENRVCDLSLLPVRDDADTVSGVLMLSFDVTDLVAAQREADAARRDAERLLSQVRATQTQMVQVEKMRAIGELASGVAHDFNNALQAILGYTELAMDSLNEPKELETHLNIITKAAQDAKSTVQRLQRFAKQNAVTSGDTVDVNAIVKDVIDLTRPIWRDAAQREGRAVDVQIDLKPVPLIFAEPSGLREVLINIVHNALNAMPHGGVLSLSTKARGESDVVIEIGDTGIGMTPEVQAQIFDPFFTTRGVEGNGLGLAVSWTIVQRHGGHIDVQSKPGQGTRFYLRLPIRGGEIVPRREPLPPPPAPTTTASVLVVDDELVVSSILTTILSRHGYEATAVSNAQEALDLLSADGASFDLVLTDHGMPGMNGLQLTAETKRRWPELPVLLLTGWGESLLQTHVTETLPDAVLGKPINQTDLLHAVSRVLRTRSEM